MRKTIPGTHRCNFCWATNIGSRDGGLDAKIAFEHTLKLEPQHPGAKRFIDAAHPSADTPRV